MRIGRVASCCTQEEIAERTGIDGYTVRDVLREMTELVKSLNSSAEHLVDFNIPHYNAWKFREKLEGNAWITRTLIPSWLS